MCKTVACSAYGATPRPLTRRVCTQARNGNILLSRFGRYRDFGLYTDSLAQYGTRMFYYVWEIPIFCLMGACGGLLGALFIHVNVKITQFRHRCVC